MKLCPKCEATYDNEVVFCRKCGTKLVDHNVCPYCGKPISTEDVFCGACGHRLKEEPHPETTPESKTETRKYNGSRVFQIIFASLFFVVALLGVLGFFGDIATASAFGLKESRSISYFFGDYAKSLEQTATLYKYPDFFLFSLAFFIIHCIFYFGGIAATLVTVGFGIYHAVNTIIKKNVFNKKYFLFIVLSSLPYLMFTSYKMLASANVDIKIGFGWGTSMLLAVDIISIVCYGFLSVYEAPKSPKAITSRILMSSSMLIMLFVSVFGATSHLSMSESTSAGTITLQSSLFSQTSSLLAAYSSAETFVFTSACSNLLISFAFSLVALVLSYVTILYLSYTKTFSKIITIVLCGLVFVFSLLTGIIGSSACTELYAVQTSMGTGVIMTLVLSIVSIAPVAVSLGLKE